MDDDVQQVSGVVGNEGSIQVRPTVGTRLYDL